MSDKHEPAKHTATHAAPHKHDDPSVEEGVKAAESHRVTTKDVAEAEHKPVKAAPPHPLVSKMVKLKDKVAETAKKHKEEVLDLRDELQKLMFELPADIPGQSLNSFNAVVTQVEEGLNMLDPDCSARAPG